MKKKDKIKTGNGIRKDCFAYREDGARKKCIALTALYCDRENCVFYKSNEQFEREKNMYL